MLKPKSIRSNICISLKSSNSKIIKRPKRILKVSRNLKKPLLNVNYLLFLHTCIQPIYGQCQFSHYIPLWTTEKTPLVFWGFFSENVGWEHLPEMGQSLIWLME